mmetsp:Transcript_31478/g.50825  ORF Transcript_31478/g.50825 Transcript_31478/m.50825 type:complete len:121 (-) Transcript_31478:750-1112(-)
MTDLALRDIPIQECPATIAKKKRRGRNFNVADRLRWLQEYDKRGHYTDTNFFGIDKKQILRAVKARTAGKYEGLNPTSRAVKEIKSLGAGRHSSWPLLEDALYQWTQEERQCGIQVLRTD